MPLQQPQQLRSPVAGEPLGELQDEVPVLCSDKAGVLLVHSGAIICSCRCVAWPARPPGKLGARALAGQAQPWLPRHLRAAPRCLAGAAGSRTWRQQRPC
jgi:hypothetical protein